MSVEATAQPYNFASSSASFVASGVGHPTGWRRHLYSSNHKDIGTTHLAFAMTAGVIGGLLSLGMRLEIQQPGMQVSTSAHTFNVFMTAPAFAAALPSIRGLASEQVSGR